MVVRCTRACLGLGWCWLRRFLTSWLCVVYHKYAYMRHRYKCNACGAKSNMLHDYAQLTHTNPYKPFTNLPLAFFLHFHNLVMT
jgi:hypothetical protein